MKRKTAFLVGVPLYCCAFLLGSSPCFAGDWASWFGPQRNGHAASDEKLPDGFKATPTPDWKISVGGGFSSPVVQGEELAYFDENGDREILHLISAKDGKEKWKLDVAEKIQDEWGAGPRSTPILTLNRVYATSGNGEFRCVDRKTGAVIWETSFEKTYGVKFLGSKAQEGTASRRGNNGSPLLMDDKIIVPVGNTQGATLVCFNAEKGTELWKMGSEEAAYSSPIVGTISGEKQIIYLNADAMVGILPATGKELWRVPLKTNAKRHACTPQMIGEMVMVSSHTFGVQAFKIKKTGSNWIAEKGWVNNEKINLSTLVLVDKTLYGQGGNKNFVAIDSTTGKSLWSQPGFGKENSSTIAVGQKLLSLTDEGMLYMLAANPEKYEELGVIQICGKNWNFPALSNQHLYIRDNRELDSYNLGNLK
jgi:outer membrane protein assembly factor BamB